jgi:MFS family permease
MLGLFLVLPVFTLYGLQFTSSRFWVGFAFGAYALTMGIFQIPFGRLSDRVGRRKVLMAGMAIFSLGSFLCAIPHWFPQDTRIWVLILGRLIQGGGSIVSTAFAAVADHFPPENRSTAMAFLGIPIGAAAAIGVVGGPLIAGWANTPFLFWLSGLLGLVTVAFLAAYLPETKLEGASPAPVLKILRTRRLLASNFGGFLINLLMAIFFFYLPLIVRNQHHVAMNRYSQILLSMMLTSGVTMFAFSMGADRGWGRELAAAAFLLFTPYAVLMFEPAWLGLNPMGLTAVVIAGILFYVAFTGLEPILPSLVSKSAPAGAYGTALGIYNTTQFMGSAIGGPLAGLLSRMRFDFTVYVLIAASLAGTFAMLLGNKPDIPSRELAAGNP